MTNIPLDPTLFKEISKAHLHTPETQRVYISGDFIPNPHTTETIEEYYHFEHKPVDGYTDDALLVTLHNDDDSDTTIKVYPLNTPCKTFCSRFKILPNLFRNKSTS